MQNIIKERPLADRIAEFAEKRKRQGQTYRKTAEELNISESTLYRYRQDWNTTDPSKQTQRKMNKGGRLSQKENYASKVAVERSREAADRAVMEEHPDEAINANDFLLDMPGTNLDVRDLGSSVRSEEEWVRGLAEKMEEGRNVQLVLYKYESPATGKEIVTTEETEAGDLVDVKAFEFVPGDLEYFDAKSLADALFQKIMNWADISP